MTEPVQSWLLPEGLEELIAAICEVLSGARVIKITVEIEGKELDAP